MTVGFAEGVLAAGDLVAGSFARYLRRCSYKSSLALALIASSSVSANCCRSAGVRCAFVEILALRAYGFEAFLAEALTLDTLSIVDAIEVRFAECRNVSLQEIIESSIKSICQAIIDRTAVQHPIVFSHLIAGYRWTGMGTVTRWAEAGVAWHSVLANGIRAARILVGCAFVDICKGQ